MREVARPLGPRYLVKPLEGDDMTTGGVLLPDEVRKRAGRGMVVGVGTGYLVPFGGERVPLELELGAVVMWDVREGIAIRVNDEELVLLLEENVQVVIEQVPDPATVRT